MRSLLPLLVMTTTTTVLSTAARADGNHAPRLSVEKQQSATVGVELFLSLDGSDADDDVITFGAEGLPDGATFEPRTGDLLWTPGPGDVGSHLVTFSANDGAATSYASTRFTVSPRPALALLDGGATAAPIVLPAGAPWRFDLSTTVDPNPVTFTVDGLPTGAVVEDGAIVWTPSDDDLGDHRLVIHLAAGDEQGDAARVLHVRPSYEEWESYALPGINYAGWIPLNAPEIGVASGPSFEIVVAQYVHRNDNVGPSHGRVSLKAELLFPSAAPTDVVLLYSASLALSLERNPQRSFLLPIFAVDVGGLYQKDLGEAVQVTPQIGIHLWQSRNIFVTATAGYLLALPQTERLHGPRFSLGGNFTFW